MFFVAMLTASCTWADPDTAARAPVAESTAADEPLNVVFILTDDQRYDMVEQMPTVSTRLAGEGLSFDTAIVTTSLCCPSRASMLSGRYAHAHGIRTLSGAHKFDARETIATWLDRAGYTTALIGKYMNANGKLAPAVPPGWDEWRTFMDNPASFFGDSLYYGYRLNENGASRAYGTAPEDYSTDVLAAFATRFVAEAEEPFFLYFAPFAPHLPSLPAERHKGLSAKAVIPVPVPEADTTDKPRHVRSRRAALEGEPTEPFAQLWVRHVRRHNPRLELESLLAVDDAVAGILDELDKRGVEGRTLVVYTSDNGALAGEHWSWGKNDAYEESIKIPLIMRLPGTIPRGSRSAELVANIDFAPTIAALTGAAVVGEIDGVSLVPVLKGQRLPREEVLLEWWSSADGPPIATPGFHGIRARDWKYVAYRDGFEELYDLANDPGELENLAVEDPEHPRMAEMRARLGKYPDINRKFP